MAEYVRMPKAHYEAACNSIRAKTGKTDLITSGAMSAEIDGITGGTAEGCVTVTFMNGAEVLFTRPVYIGDDCPDPYVQNRIELPTKESTAQYDYTFNGWATADGGSADSNALKGITEDKVLYAAFAESVRMYTVTYYDEDGVTVLHTEQLAYGSMPTYVPTKEGAGFAGWTPDTPVTGNTSYTAVWTSVLASGSCGTIATYTLMSDGVLTISGTGTTTSYPWKTDYKNNIVEVVIGEGITSVANMSFSGCSALVKATLPSTLTNLAERMFTGSGLTSITIPASVTRINGYALNCDNLTSITIPASVTYIGAYAFSSIHKLTSAYFEDPDGWSISGYGAVDSAVLADPAEAAKRLTCTSLSPGCGQDKGWTKS